MRIAASAASFFRLLFGLLAALYFGFAVAVLGLRYWILPSIDDHRPAIERMASRSLGAEVRVDRVAASWFRLNPRLDIEGMRILGPDGAVALALPQVHAVVSWRSVLTMELELLSLQVDAPEVMVTRDARGGVSVAGFPVTDTDDTSDALIDQPVARWLLSQREVIVRGAGVRWVDEQRVAPPLQIGGLTAVMRNSVWGQTAFSMRASLPSHLAGALDLRAQLSRSLFTLPGEPTSWRGQVYVATDGIDLAAWRDWVDLPLTVARGKAAVRAWVDVQDGRLDEWVVDGALQDALLGPAGGTADLTIGQARGRARAGGFADGPPATWATLPGDAGTLAAVGGGLTTGIDDGRAPGRTVAPLVSWSLKGRYSGVTLPAGPPGTETPHPGFNDLTGTVALDSHGAGRTRIRLQAQNFSAVFPQIFEQPQIPVARLRTELDLALPPGLPPAVRISQLELDMGEPGARAALTLAGNWHGGGKSAAGVIDVRGRVQQADIGAVQRFMPLEVDAEARHWLRDALTTGQILQADIKLRGDLYDFPFAGEDRQAGDFRVAGTVRDVRMDYVPGVKPAWPALEKLEGEVVFERTGLTVHARSGQVRVDDKTTLALADVRAAIPDVEHRAVLTVGGNVAGSANGFLGFINGSPVGDMLEGKLETARASGTWQVPLSLTVPLLDPYKARVRGSVHFSGNDVWLDRDSPVFKRARGRLDFTEKHLVVPEIRATLLEGPIRVEGGPDADGATLLRFTGELPAASLAQTWPRPGFARIGGRAAYEGSVTVPVSGVPRFTVKSSLEGMSLDLPAPMGKAAAERLPLWVEWGPDEQGGPGSPRQWFTATLGQVVNVLLEFDPGVEGAAPSLRRGALGVNRAASLPDAGLSVSAEMPTFDVDRWQSIAESFAPPASASGEAGNGASANVLALLDRVSLSTAHFVNGTTRFDNLKVFATRPVPDGWRLDIESDQAAGAVSWRESSPGHPGHITARLSRLVLTTDDSNDAGDDLPFDVDEVADIPGIDLVVDAFSWNDRALGHLELQAHNLDRGRTWRLGKLQVENPDATLTATGTWQADAAGARLRRTMTLDTALAIRDAGGLLTRMGSPDLVQGGSGTLSGRVAWHGLPYSFKPETLSGKLELALDDGRFLAAGNSAGGRLISVLSLQSLGNMATFNFANLFGEGFAWNTVRAHASIASGVARTDDFKMSGQSATVVLAGTADMTQERQNLKAVVVPHFDASGATLLYGLAVNPAVGLGAFVTQWLLAKPLARAFTYEFSITGPWSAPHVERIDAPRTGIRADGGSRDDFVQP